MRAVIYLRVSTDGQVDGYGLPMQEDACLAFARAHGMTVVSVVQDAGISGTKGTADRPALAEAIDLVDRGDADALLVATLDRLARELHVQEAVLASLWRLGGRVFTADHGEVKADDPDDPYRRAMRLVMGAMVDLERNVIVKRLRDGRRAKAARGGKAVGDYPFGSSKDGPVPAEQAVLAEIEHHRSEGKTWEEVASVLNEAGLRPRHAPLWSPRNVAKVARLAS